MAFSAGDRVQVSYGYGWDGEGVVLGGPYSGKNYDVKLRTGQMKGIAGGFPEKVLTLIVPDEHPATLDDLYQIVDNLRNQGYGIDPINITVPSARFTI